LSFLSAATFSEMWNSRSVSSSTEYTEATGTF
jgi:hypothetical protein